MKKFCAEISPSSARKYILSTVNHPSYNGIFCSTYMYSIDEVVVSIVGKSFCSIFEALFCNYFVFFDYISMCRMIKICKILIKNNNKNNYQDIKIK